MNPWMVTLETLVDAVTSEGRVVLDDEDHFVVEVSQWDAEQMASVLSPIYDVTDDISITLKIVN